MLTLDTEQLTRQAAETEARRKQDQARASLAAYIAKKEETVMDDGGLPVWELAAQLGTPLTSEELKRRLLLMNPRLIFEASIRYPDRMGIYIEEDQPGLLYLDAAVRKRMVVAMPIGIMPERTVHHYKTTRVPDPEIRGNFQTVREFTSQTRGWRTVLYRLLAAGLITRGQVEREFPANEKSQLWHQLVN